MTNELTDLDLARIAGGLDKGKQDDSSDDGKEGGDGEGDEKAPASGGSDLLSSIKKKLGM